MPINYVQRYPGLSPKEAVERTKGLPVRRLHPRSINAYLGLLAAVFSWGAQDSLIRLPDGNPAARLTVSVGSNGGSREDVRRRPFTVEELATIFSSPLYTGCQDDGPGYNVPGARRPKRGRFWVPLIALFSGVRLREACQLRTQDVVEVDGLPLMLVRDDGEDQSVKTKAATRRVPVHPELIRLGFLEHVQTQMSKGAERLFPELPSDKHGSPGGPFSKWFGRFLSKRGLTSPDLVFHCFRHGFQDRLREAEVHPEIRDVLCGWSPDGQGAAYGAGFSARRLTEELGRVSYPGLDLTRLAADSREQAQRLASSK